MAAVLAISTAAACSNPEQAKREHFDNANRFMEAGKTQEAILEYRNALQEDPRYGEARLKLAEAYQAVGNFNQARREFIRAADLLPQDTVAQVQASRYLLLAGQFEDARTRIQLVIDRDPTNVDAQMIMGRALVGLKDLEGAVREIEEAIKLDPNRATTYSSLAAVQYAQGDRARAKASFEKAVEVDPRSMQAHLALAYFRWMTGDTVGAEDTFKGAIAIDPKDTLANRMIIAFYVSSNRAEQAEPYLKQLASGGAVQPALGLADYYRSLGRSSEAAAILQPLTSNPQAQSAAEIRLAAMAYNSKDTARAHALIDTVIKREPSNVQALLAKAEWLAREGKVQDALTRAQAAVKSDPQSAPAHFALGLLHDRLRNRKEAVAAFTEVIRLNPRATAAQLNLSRLSLYEGSPDRAVTFAEAALTNAPGNPAARASLVQGLLARGDTSRAEQELAPLLKQYPQVGQIHALNAALKVQRKELPAARAAYEKALSLSPTLFEAFVGLTRLDLAEDKIAQARSRVDARVAADPDNTLLQVLAADVYRRQRDFPKAEATLRKVIQTEPGLSTAYGMLAEVLLASGKLDAARIEFDQMAQRDPKNIAAQTMAAMIVDSQRKTADAKKRYEAIVASDPSAAVAANNLAWMYAEEGARLDDALRLAQGAAARLPNNAEIQDTIGWIYYKKELPALAVSAFQRSIEQAPENPLYHKHLAMAQWKAGNAEGARQAAQQAIKLRPDYADAQTILAATKG